MAKCWSPNCPAKGAEIDSAYCPHCSAPQRFGKYVVRRMLGSGAFGEVYLVSDSSLFDKEFALKLLKAEWTSDWAKRFEEEAKILASLTHDNVIRIHEFSKEPPFLVADYMPGGSLADLLTRTPKLDRQLFFDVFTATAKALSYVHTKIVHRDLKPENVLMDEASRPHLADFGIARIIEIDKKNKTRIGTPAYMAPEVILGKPYDHRCDIYSFGVMAYRALTGILPYDGDSAHELFQKVIIGDARSPAEIDPQIPKPLSDAVMRMLANEPGYRYQSAGSVLDELLLLGAPHGSVTEIDAFQDMLFSIYGPINHERGLGNILSQIFIHIASLLKIAGQGGQPGIATSATAEVFGWLMAFTSLHKRDASEVILGKYAGNCPKCTRTPCACTDETRKKEVLWRKPSDGKRLRLIADFQQMFGQVYPDNVKMGLPAICDRMIMELAELVEVENKHPDDADRDAHLLSELADCYAWTFAAANMLHMDVTQALNARYPGKCRRCGEKKCKCRPKSGVFTHKYVGLM